jgi:lipopolysaccharide export system permease protein
MSGFQRYLFRNVLRTLTAIVGGLALIALLATGIQQVDRILQNGQSTGVFLWVSALAVPSIVSLMLPIGLFIATAAALNVAHRENEIVVAQASGLSNWQVASPVLRLATLAAILHLGLNLWIQPAASRELRETITAASSELAASLVKQGAFVTLDAGLTTFARRVDGSKMTDFLASDSRNPEETVTFIAKRAYLTEEEGEPVLVLEDAQRQTLRPNGVLEITTFGQGPLPLGPFVNAQRALVLEESDRYLPELFYPDTSNYYDHQNVDMLAAEGHARISAPLLNLAMAMLAILAVLGGDFSRRGYAQRIAIASAAALALRLAAFGAVAAGRDDPSLNFLQYLLPISVIAIVSYFFFMKPGKAVRRRKRRYMALRPAAG